MIRLPHVLSVLLFAALCAWGLTRLVGIPWWWAALVVLPVAAVLLLLLAAPPGVEPSWAALPEPPNAAVYLDASMFAGRLADAATDQSRYRTRVQPRLAALALTALRRRPGLADLSDLSDPRAVAALGAQWHTALTDRSARQPEPRILLALLASLEE